MLSNNLSVNAAGHLCFAGQDVCELAERFGTPLYLMDEDRIRENCRIYLTAFAEAFGDHAAPAYASKAASFRHMYRIMRDEDMYIDVVSAGEIYTAVKADFPTERSKKSVRLPPVGLTETSLIPFCISIICATCAPL